MIEEYGESGDPLNNVDVSNGNQFHRQEVARMSTFKIFVQAETIHASKFNWSFGTCESSSWIFGFVE